MDAARASVPSLIEDAWPHARCVGVVSDTHLPYGKRTYPTLLLERLRDVDLILHAGDLTSLAALEPLTAIAPVLAVCGNVDPPEVRAVVPDRRIVRAGAFRIGLVHGYQGPGRTTPERARRSFDAVDAVVFGHSHAPLNEMRDGVLLFNPGSPTDRRDQASYSFGILHTEDTLWGEIITFR